MAKYEKVHTFARILSTVTFDQFETDKVTQNTFKESHYSVSPNNVNVDRFKLRALLTTNFSESQQLG